MRLSVAVALLAAVSTLAPSSAAACSCSDVQHWGFLAPENGRLPANAVGVAWYRPTGSRAFTLILAQVTVEEKRGDGTFDQVPATFEPVTGFPGVFMIGPRDGLRVGATYRFTDRGERAPKAPEQVFVTVDRTLLQAGTPLLLTIWPLYSETILVGSSLCSSPLWVAQTLAETALPRPAAAWHDQLLFRTLVDGKQWRPMAHACGHVPPGRSWRDSTGEELLYGACPPPPGESRKYGWHDDNKYLQGLESTQHAVKVEAFLPGTDIALESETVMADLSCPGHLEP